MMDKTINVNIAGTLFRIDEEAFVFLRDYLQSINNRLRNVQGGLEIVEDIELRIAEIFNSNKGLAGVITRENIETMISIIGKPEDFDIKEDGTESYEFSAQKKRMYRNPDDSIISGVCGGIGAYVNTDPVLFRILFVIFTAFFGIGLFIYLALWIALPVANTDSRKKEMYGNANYSSRRQHLRPDGGKEEPRSYSDYKGSSTVSNAINEIFRAIGRVFYIVMRIFLIIIGITLVLTGFMLIITFIVIFVFKYPGGFSTGAFDLNIIHLSDFLNYIVTPSVAPWIITLTLIAIILPLIAFIYWGVKMIFWFNARDGIYNLTGLVLWFITVAALSIILFSEGVSFSETAKTSSKQIVSDSPEILYLKTGKKISDLNYDKELLLTEHGYDVLISEKKNEIYIRPCLKINKSDDDSFMVDLRKRSSGRSRIEARKKTEDLLYNYRIEGDTLLIDEYFIIPSGRKWSADNIGINIYIPEGTIITADRELEVYFSKYRRSNRNDDDNSLSETGDRSWILTEDGLKKFNN
jgi:phage shock protein PspC (stress-responsive transcriptional regulator)